MESEPTFPSKCENRTTVFFKKILEATFEDQTQRYLLEAV